MAIFNSLGSNYSRSFAWKSLFGKGNKRDLEKVVSTLSDHYGGEAILTYKGRQALELALRRSGLAAGSSVGINGYTCYVVYQAVLNAGYKPVFIDVERRKLNFGLEELKLLHQSEPTLAAVIVQNTLGFPCDMVRLSAYCKENQLLIIEDLAHSQGLVYADGRETGTVGDFTMLSFSQDKPLDVVAGGALIDRRDVSKENEPLSDISFKQQCINRMYPFWTMLIRTTYPIGIGRYIHFILKRLHLLATPMSDNVMGLYKMTGLAAKLFHEKWSIRDDEIRRRQSIGGIYDQGFPEELKLENSIYGQPTYLRYPAWVNDRPAFVNMMKSQHFYIGDTWYDAPIAPSRYMDKTHYEKGMCPNAEELSMHIINLPTHIYVDESQANNIVRKVESWQE